MDPSTMQEKVASASTTTSTKVEDIDIDKRSKGEPGLLFYYLNPVDPCKARRRFGKLYWVAWKRFIMSFFLSLFGITFLIVGVACMMACTDFDRGVAFFFVGALMAMPGFYASITLLFYLRGKKGYSYKMLPDYE